MTVSNQELRIERDSSTPVNRRDACDGPATSAEEHQVSLSADRPFISTGAEGVRHFTETVGEEKQCSCLNGQATPPPPFRPPLEVVRVGSYANGVVVLSVGGELDLSTAPQLANHLHNHLEANPRGTEFVVDLSEVSFLGAKGIAALIDAAHDAHLRGCGFAIIGCRPIFVRILEIVDAREMLNVLPLDLDRGDRAR